MSNSSYNKYIKYEVVNIYMHVPARNMSDVHFYIYKIRKKGKGNTQCTLKS